MTAYRVSSRTGNLIPSQEIQYSLPVWAFGLIYHSTGQLSFGRLGIASYILAGQHFVPRRYSHAQAQCLRALETFCSLR